jgi:hypothetical protein
MRASRNQIEGGVFPPREGRPEGSRTSTLCFVIETAVVASLDYMLDENATRAAELGGQQPNDSRSSMDYHDWKMLELERTAEQRLHGALLALANDEVAARKEVQRCTIMLDNIRQLRTAASRLRYPIG